MSTADSTSTARPALHVRTSNERGIVYEIGITGFTLFELPERFPNGLRLIVRPHAGMAGMPGYHDDLYVGQDKNRMSSFMQLGDVEVDFGKTMADLFEKRPVCNVEGKFDLIFLPDRVLVVPATNLTEVEKALALDWAISLICGHPAFAPADGVDITMSQQLRKLQLEQLSLHVPAHA